MMSCCMLVCVWVRIQILNMILSRLRCKTQWWEANHKVGRSWVPNTFPKAYLNTKPISLVVRSMVLPREDTIFMVPRPLQKLGGNSNSYALCPQVSLRWLPFFETLRGLGLQTGGRCAWPTSTLPWTLSIVGHCAS